ncbi:hypothetical protein CBOM_03691 [Ceraceosorus bombacis]|uniref:Uncharacterized protein n=1 Tax=Ceraceosorus bombacis TaxID=401625 RepID=A0A0P1BH68_9BASI|nr:hypothetical protein CBOM_03691 [Ceraceosorus bombacis]
MQRKSGDDWNRPVKEARNRYNVGDGIKGVGHVINRRGSTDASTEVLKGRVDGECAPGTQSLVVKKVVIFTNGNEEGSPVVERLTLSSKPLAKVVNVGELHRLEVQLQVSAGPTEGGEPELGIIAHL